MSIWIYYKGFRMIINLVYMICMTAWVVSSSWLSFGRLFIFLSYYVVILGCPELEDELWEAQMQVLTLGLTCLVSVEPRGI